MRAALLLIALMPFAASAADDLAPLSDEFNDASTLAQWKRIYAVEGWGANQLELQDINTTRPGRMVMMPFTSTWYNDYRGELTFKEVQGDFVVTTDVEASQRGGTGPPRSSYSLAGIMVRVPRAITSPAMWHAGGENYIFLSLGMADRPGNFQFEVKTTLNSNSVLDKTIATGGHAVIQVARIGPHLITLKKDGGVWSVHRRYYRPDFPSIVQIGMTTYTDFNTVLSYSPLMHNSMVIHGGSPDLVAAFDYFRFERPRVPAALLNANFTDNSVSEAQLLTFLGANAGNLSQPVTRHRSARH